MRVWDANTGQPVGAPLTGHTGPVDSVAPSLVRGARDRRPSQSSSVDSVKAGASLLVCHYPCVTKRGDEMDRGYKPTPPPPSIAAALPTSGTVVACRTAAGMALAGLRTDTAQRDRALDSLVVDGLVEQTADGRFALAGEGSD